MTAPIVYHNYSIFLFRFFKLIVITVHSNIQDCETLFNRFDEVQHIITVAVSPTSNKGN